MKTVVVIPNWNGADLISDCLKSLKSQKHPHHVIVVDNGSDDDSVSIIEQNFPLVEILKQTKNLGFAGGVNAGIRKAIENGFDAIALLNNDAIADKAWLSELVMTLEQDSTVGIATGKLLRLDGKYLDSTGEEYSVWGAPFPRGRNQADSGQFDKETDIFAATAGATLYRTELFKSVGLFDEAFFAYYEDVDLSFRSRLGGWKVRYNPDARAYHHVSASFSKLGKTVRFHVTKNTVLLYVKNMPGLLFWLYLPLFTVWLIRLGITNTIKGAGFAYIRGLLRAFSSMPRAVRERWGIQGGRKVSASEVNRLLYKHLPPLPRQYNTDK